VGSREFINFIQNNGLIDLGFVGPRYTWCNNRSGSARVWKRLDRCYAISNWLTLYSDHTVRHLSRIASDHYPILLSIDHFFQGSRPFRYEKFWFSYPKSRDLVREVWRIPIQDAAACRVSCRLELLRRWLLHWNRIEVGHLINNLKSIETTIQGLQDKEDRMGSLLVDEMDTLQHHLRLHHTLLLNQEVMWR